VHNAFFDDSDGGCECRSGWDNSTTDGDLSCSYYNGTCHPRCGGTALDEDLTCTGPFSSDCGTCNLNSYRGDNYECLCYPDYAGDDCSYYTGLCNAKCETCDGPVGCITLMPNAADAEDCDSNWYGADCSMYGGNCSDPQCLVCNHTGGCLECVANAFHDDDGCACDGELWSASTHFCNVWDNTAICAHACQTCSGPSKWDCMECTANSYRKADGSCECNPYYWGLKCQYYRGPCPSLCTACDDHKTCTSCIFAATLSITDACACTSEGYSGFYC